MSRGALAAAGLVGVILALGLGLLLAGGPGGAPVATGAATQATGGSVVASVLPSAPGPTGSAAPLPTLAPTMEPTAPPTEQPATPKPTATPKTDPAIVTFKVPVQEDCTGTTAGSIEVSWTIARATGVTISIDGPGIYDSYSGTSGSIDLPFGCDQSVLKHSYTLTTTGGTGPAATSTKTVRTRAPEIVSFSLPNTATCPSTIGSVAINLRYEIKAATGTELERDGQPYRTYSGKVVGPTPIAYDCTKESQTFVLTTTGGYGEPDTSLETVERDLAP